MSDSSYHMPIKYASLNFPFVPQSYINLSGLGHNIVFRDRDRFDIPRNITGFTILMMPCNYEPSD